MNEGTKVEAKIEIKCELNNKIEVCEPKTVIPHQTVI
jgi:hypothetical protein